MAMPSAQIPEWMDALWPDVQAAVRAASQEEWRRACVPRGLTMPETMAFARAWRQIGSGVSLLRTGYIVWFWATGGDRSVWPTPTELREHRASIDEAVG